MVVFAEPTQAYRLGFALGVQLFVERPEGLTSSSSAGPRSGATRCSGRRRRQAASATTEAPRDAVLADAAEEIGLSEADLPGFQPVAVVISDDTGSALVVYHAKLREGAEPQPSPTKVAQIYWSASPADLGAQVSADTVASLGGARAWREREAAPA